MDQVEVEVVKLEILELFGNDLFSDVWFVGKEWELGGNKEVGSLKLSVINVLLDDLSDDMFISIGLGSVHVPVSGVKGSSQSSFQLFGVTRLEKKSYFEENINKITLKITQTTIISNISTYQPGAITQQRQFVSIREFHGGD